MIIVLNGAPRAGKSSIAQALATSDSWVCLGVDETMAALAPHELPGLGLRPGGERPDLELSVRAQYRDLYRRVVAASRHTDVAVDVGHHDSYSQPLHTLADAANQMRGHHAFLVGVRCPIEEIMRRRDRSGAGYVGSASDGVVPEPVRRWQDAVHQPGVYDLEVDTSLRSPQECAADILDHVATHPAHAFAELRSR